MDNKSELDFSDDNSIDDEMQQHIRNMQSQNMDFD